MLTQLPMIFPGDVVTYGRGSTLYKVTKTKQVKCNAVESANGRRVELRIEHCVKAEDPSLFVDTEETLAPAPKLALGMAVRFRRQTSKNAGVFVVLNQTQGGWKVARLGGKDGMRYFYNLEANMLVPVDEINSVDWE